jgi:hypothetical protein
MIDASGYMANPVDAHRQRRGKLAAGVFNPFFVNDASCCRLATALTSRQVNGLRCRVQSAMQTTRPI